MTPILISVLVTPEAFSPRVTTGIMTVASTALARIDFLETKIDLVAELGLELHTQHHIGALDES